MFVWARTDTGVEEHGRFADTERAALACWARPRLVESRVTVALGTSFISLDQARRNVELEVGEADFEEIVDRSRDRLGRAARPGSGRGRQP